MADFEQSKFLLTEAKKPVNTAITMHGPLAQLAEQLTLNQKQKTPEG